MQPHWLKRATDVLAMRERIYQASIQQLVDAETRRQAIGDVVRPSGRLALTKNDKKFLKHLGIQA